MHSFTPLGYRNTGSLCNAHLKSQTTNLNKLLLDAFDAFINVFLMFVVFVIKITIRRHAGIQTLEKDYLWHSDRYALYANDIISKKKKLDTVILFVLQTFLMKKSISCVCKVI